jgi:hypothetical protein
MNQIPFFKNKKIISNAQSSFHLRDAQENLIIYVGQDTINGQTYNKQGFKVHPDIGCLTYPIPVGIPKEFIDLSSANKKWESQGANRIEEKIIEEKLIFNPDFESHTRTTSSIISHEGSTLIQKSTTCWSDPSNLTINSTFFEDCSEYKTTATLRPNKENLTSTMLSIYQQLIKIHGNPTDIWHKSFQSQGDAPQIFFNILYPYFNLEDLISTKGEILELGFNVNKNLPTNWHKIGYQKLSNGKTIWFEIHESEGNNLEIIHNNKKDYVREFFKKDMTIYE